MFTQYRTRHNCPVINPIVNKHQSQQTPQSTNSSVNKHHSQQTPESTNTTVNKLLSQQTPLSTNTSVNRHHSQQTPQSTNTTVNKHHSQQTPQSTNSSVNKHQSQQTPESTNTRVNKLLSQQTPQSTNTTVNKHHSQQTPQSTDTTVKKLLSQQTPQSTNTRVNKHQSQQTPESTNTSVNKHPSQQTPQSTKTTVNRHHSQQTPRSTNTTVNKHLTVSVSVSCATLVAISLERFYAICQPLRSRKWQTLKHSYRVILAIWVTSIGLMVPIAVFNKIIKLQNGSPACREVWSNHLLESMYTVLLDAVLLVIPLFLMGFSYARIAKELWSDVSISSGEPSSPISEPDPQRFDGKEKQNGFGTPIHQSPLIPRRHIARSVSSESSAGKNQVQVLHPAYNIKVLANKKRVVKMLCVVVMEYFICWTPLYLVNSWTTLDYNSARNYFSPLLKTVILSLAYLSSCIHPITYCFMNRRFRQSFVDAFKCRFRNRLGGFTFYSEASQNNGGSDIVRYKKPSIGRNIKITWRRHH
ncbi:hypothetical protein Btru_078114 [Bulinus truncatus]|nr:hypothetical protein Btru_078114 [Bulinus truncatus]